MPASVDKQSETVNTALGNMTIYTFVSEIHGGSFMVSYVDYPDQIIILNKELKVSFGMVDKFLGSFRFL